MSHNKLAILVGGGPAPGINSVIGAATIRARLEGIEVVGIRDGFTWIMQGDIDHVVPLTIDTVSRIHFRGGSYLGIARANPTKDPALLDQTIDCAAAPQRVAARDHRRRRHGVLRHEARRARRRPHPRRPRAEDDRQRPRSAVPRRHLRVPVRPPLRRRHRQEPDGRRQDDDAVVFRDRDGAEGGPPGARHRESGGRDDDPHHRGIHTRRFVCTPSSTRSSGRFSSG